MHWSSPPHSPDYEAAPRSSLLKVGGASAKDSVVRLASIDENLHLPLTHF